MVATVEGDDAAMIPLIDALKLLAGTDRPVHRIGFDAQFALDVLQQHERIHGGAVHLIDKCKNRNMTKQADLKELFGLGLHTFAGIDHHDG